MWSDIYFTHLEAVEIPDDSYHHQHLVLTIAASVLWLNDCGEVETDNRPQDHGLSAGIVVVSDHRMQRIV